MLLKGQLHIHTTCSDGSLTPQEVADVYAGLGFDFLAFTDHEQMIRSSYRRALASLRTGLLIFSGVELTVRGCGGFVHLSRIEGDCEILHIFNHPADCGLPPCETQQCIAEVARRHPLDAIEATSHGFATPQFDFPEIGYPQVAADDSHNREGCGRAWIELDCDLNRDAILIAIREGRFQNGYATGSPATFGRRPLEIPATEKKAR
jgi:hypothetical protein